MIKISTATQLPVILIDDTDFKTPETGVAFGSVTCKYRKHNETSWSTKTIDGSNWTELGNGHYVINFSASDLDTIGIFEYVVIVSGALQFPGKDDVHRYIDATNLITAIWNNATRTLTSFGTLIADIWSYATRTLTSFGTLVTDVWGNATRTLTAGTKDSEIDSIKVTVEDTNTKVDDFTTENYNGDGE